MPKTFDVDVLAEELELDEDDIVELLQDLREFLRLSIPELGTIVARGDVKNARSI